MQTNHNGDRPSETLSTPPPRRVSWSLTLIVCAIIIGVGIGGASYLEKTAPQAKKRTPKHNIPIVKTKRLVPAPQQVILSAMGAVVPAKEMTLKTRVSGQVQSTHPEFIEGGLIPAGRRVLKIDPKDYELAIARAQSDVANAQYQLKVEMGYQDVARREWALLGSGSTDDNQEAELALRKPHLAKARSDLAAARADLEKARLDLARTEVMAPFNAIVRKKSVEVGSQVTAQGELAELVGTDQYRIQVSLPVERLTWIRIPRTNREKGAAATILYRGNRLEGRVTRLLSDLESQGRMARVLVTVNDPLRLAAEGEKSAPPLLIGEYVRVEIKGKKIENAFRIPRNALRNNDTIWTLTDAHTLKIMPVTTIWRDVQSVLIKEGITPGLNLIVSDLAMAVDGIALKPADMKKTKKNTPSHEKSRKPANG